MWSGRQGLNPGLDLDSIVIPHDRGVHEGKTITELRIMIQASNISDGAGFWSYIYFERLLQPESDMAAAALSDLPRASSEGRLRERDHLQDLLRWAIGRFARLRDVTGDLTNYLSTVSEMETSSKQRMEDLGMKILEMVNGIVGLSASVRHVSEETSKNHRAEVKHLENIAWQLGGSGKNINTSLKVTLTSSGKIMSQVATKSSNRRRTRRRPINCCWQ